MKPRFTETIIFAPFVIIFTIIIISTYANIKNSSTIRYVTAKVEKTFVQQNIKKESTEYRYLVITDKETFICKNDFINGKFNNSDIFFKIKEGQTYTFKVSGIGKSMFFDYSNILEVQQKQ